MQKNENLPLKTLLLALEEWAPAAWQESYDNAGLVLGRSGKDLSRVLICFDLTPDVVDEAIQKNVQLIISHHPPIFKGIKKIHPDSRTGYMLKRSLQHDIAWYSMHTNLDNTLSGVNRFLSRQLELQAAKPLVPLKGVYRKLQVYVPSSHAPALAQALAEAGCGAYRNYDSCHWECAGTGTFRALENARPFVGDPGKPHTEAETKLEFIYPAHKQRQVIGCIEKNHPYEEPAFDLFCLENESMTEGAGVIGTLPVPLSEQQLLDKLKSLTGVPCIRHSGFAGRNIRTLALCGGSGSAFIGAAQAQKADVYVTGDLKYHDFTDAEPGTWLVDIGHFESEQFVKELIYEYITEKFPNFAAHISERSSNPVSFY